MQESTYTLIFHSTLKAIKNAGAASLLSQRSPYSCSIIEFAPNMKLIDKMYIDYIEIENIEV